MGVCVCVLVCDVQLCVRVTNDIVVVSQDIARIRRRQIQSVSSQHISVE